MFRLSCRLLAVLLLALLPHAARADECALADAAADVASAHRALVAMPAPEDLDTAIPAATQRGIVRLKDALGALLAARMSCAVADEKADAIVADINAALRPLAAACDGQCAAHPYHPTPVFAAERTDDTRHLLAIVARIGIECGSDAVLWIYESAAQRWRERLHWQAPPYDKVSGALEAFDYRISPPDASGDWYVLVKDIMPWCSSTWSTIRYAVLRPGDDAKAQQIVFHAQDSVWWGNDDTGEIAATAGEFDVRFHAASIEPAVHNRVHIRHFAIDGAQVRRMQPVALTPRDFVDEWIVSKWADATRWSAPDNRPALAQWHGRMQGADSPYYEFFAARACASTQDASVKSRVEVEVLDPRDRQTYFLLVDGSRDFRMLRIATSADAHCAGADLLPEMLTQ